MSVASAKAPSAVTVASNRFVAEHLAAATALGDSLADLVFDTDAFVAAIGDGFKTIADPLAVDGIRSVTPGLGPVLGVRLPLMDAAQKAFKRSTRKTPTSLLVDAMDHLLRQETREIRWFGMWNLARLLPTDPERTWQLLRRAAREADEWISVDTLAHPYGEGILRDAHRWSELEQLVYSPSRWERRLVGSTIATIPHVHGAAGGRDRPVDRARPGSSVNSSATTSRTSRRPCRGHCARSPTWTLPRRPASSKPRREQLDSPATGIGPGSSGTPSPSCPAETATRLKADLDGIRRRPGAPATSRAAAAVAQFVAAGTSGSAPRAAHVLEE